MNLNVNMIFENLFKSESLTNVLGHSASTSSMTPIYEETTTTGSNEVTKGQRQQQPTESRYGTLRPFRNKRQQTAKLSGRNTISGPHGSTCLPDDNNAILTSRRNSIVGVECLGGDSTAVDPLVCNFERSGSTKSYIKNRGPFSRLWQMRRRSFSQFELSTVGLPNHGSKILGSSSGHLHLLDFDECDTPGNFHPIADDHWVSELELQQSALNKQEESGGGSEQLDRVSVNAGSTDDYGFLPVQTLHHGLSSADGTKSQSSKSKNDGAAFTLSDCDEEENQDSRFPVILPRNPSRTLNHNRWSNSPGRGTLSNGNSSHYGSTSVHPHTGFSSAGGNGKRPSKLKRRKAYYREKKEGRSRSLTHIDNLDPAMLLRNEDMDSKSEPDTSQDQLLFVPGPTESRDSRRKKLARSQVSSSEFFSVCFEGELGLGLEEFLPATRGTCLGEALRPLCDKKNIDLASLEIYVDSSKTPLPAAVHTDTYFVAGKNLIVRAKEADSKFHTRSFKQPSRKSSQRGKHKFFSVSTEDANYSGTATNTTFDNSSLSIGSGSSTVGGAVGSAPTWQPGSHSGAVGLISHEGSLKVKNTKQTNRWSGLFSNSKDNSKMDLLVEQLNTYSKNGIPKPNILSCDTDDIQSSYCPEDDWKAIVGGSLTSEMSERARQQQTAIWELVETEIVYLKTIKVITDLFLACLYNLQSANILNEIDRDQLFSNIPDIYKANKTLWLDCILPMVEKARETKQPLQPQELRSGFLKFGSTCQPYTRYCLDQTKCQHYCREKYQENELFKAYLAWCETRKECNRLRLMDILVRPMQRMTKYSLLLKAIFRHTEDPEQRRCLEEMITSVERFVKSVNCTLRSRQDAERLQAIAERIECYDVVVLPSSQEKDELESIVKLHSKLDLFHPMPGCRSKRWLLFEGDLKIKDSLTSKMDVHCFLFTDMLLICKPVGRKGEKMKVCRQPLIVDRLVCREFSKDSSALGLVYLNEYGTTVAALSFHTNNEPKLIRQWLEHIRKAQKLYIEAKEKSHEVAEYPEGEEDEGTSMMYLSSRSPRGGSSRASQLSSLVHSHSGSIEMNEVSAISSRAVSFEQELRGSSLSSDDGNANDPPGVSSKSRSLSTDTGPLRPSSPRLDRRLFLSKSPTPNTLTVQIPVPNLSGQSLPNLTAASDSSPPTYAMHHHSLTVPKSLSPTQRGVSYPPPSPRSLRRSHALLQSRNPPLQKAKNIVSPENHAAIEKCASLDVQVPEIRGVIPPSNDVSPVAPTPQSSFSPTHPAPASGVVSQDELSRVGAGTTEPYTFEDEVLIVHSNPEYITERSQDYYGGSTTSCDRAGSCSGSDQTYGRDSGCGEVGITTTCFSKRLARNERSDKRYHTAGAIEDIKKENCRDKDSAIHKRLSWNYGNSPQQQLHHHHSGPNMQSDVLKNRQFFSSESMSGSVRSSSGVSSTSSLLNYISHSDLDLETTLETIEGVEPRDARLPDVLIAVSEPDPEPGNVAGCNFCAPEREVKSRCSNSSDTTCPLSSVQSTCSSSCPNKEDNLVASASSCPGSPKLISSRTGGVIIMKDFILTDASLEASEV